MNKRASRSLCAENELASIIMLAAATQLSAAYVAPAAPAARNNAVMLSKAGLESLAETQNPVLGFWCA